MRKPLFTGACTALVTPFLGKEVNYPMLEQLIRRQIDAGIEAIVLCGTTGEAAALSDSEKLELILHAKAIARDRCLIIAGTGSNNSEHAVSLSKAAELAGADALLVVSPYYSKATPEGLFKHYTRIAAAVSIPVIIYNVPGRTGQDIPVKVYRKLSQIENIAGVKEASADLSKVADILSLCPKDFYVWSGSDELTVPIMSLGGKGVISVLSNVYPELVQEMTKAALDGDFDTASALQLQFHPLVHTLFREVNPVPAKAAMKLIGYDCGHCRLPLTEASRDTLEELRLHLQK